MCNNLSGEENTQRLPAANLFILTEHLKQSLSSKVSFSSYLLRLSKGTTRQQVQTQTHATTCSSYPESNASLESSYILHTYFPVLLEIPVDSEAEQRNKIVMHGDPRYLIRTGTCCTTTASRFLLFEHAVAAHYQNRNF